MHVDADSGAVLTDISVPEASAITVGDDVWVAAKSESFHIDPVTGAILTTINAGAGPFGSITADGESVWVRNTTDFLVEFDAQTGEVVQTHTPSMPRVVATSCWRSGRCGPPRSTTRCSSLCQRTERERGSKMTDSLSDEAASTGHAHRRAASRASSVELSRVWCA